MIAHVPESRPFPKNVSFAALITVAVAFFGVLFVLLDNAAYRYLNALFPNIGTSAWLATLWGVVSRAHLLIIVISLAIWKPHLLGFQIGSTRKHWRMLAVTLILNCGFVAIFLAMSGTTPYSGNQWLLTEIVTVPIVEEAFWRGLVFAILLSALTRVHPTGIANHLAVWLSGLAFGLLHAGNALAGVSLSFVAIQVLNAAIWGVRYGYARAKTESVYPPMLLHSAMNLVVVLF